jgi:AraC family L-rhamnose operon regulatory protein RhaS
VRLFLEALHRRIDEPWTLESMAEACGIGRSQFSTLCHKTINLTPMTYLNDLRMEHAASLLGKNPLMSVTEIAFRCGFQSSQYFARVFRMKYGASPGAWRRAVRKPGVG